LLTSWQQLKLDRYLFIFLSNNNDDEVDASVYATGRILAYGVRILMRFFSIIIIDVINWAQDRFQIFNNIIGRAHRCGNTKSTVITIIC